MRRVEAGARVEHVRAADQQVGRRGAAARTSALDAGAAHARLRLGAAGSPAARGEHLVEHRHPHDDAGLDLLR